MLIIKALNDKEVESIGGDKLYFKQDNLYILANDIYSFLLEKGLEAILIKKSVKPKEYNGENLNGKKVIILNGFALGDSIQITPIIKAFKRKFKESFIALEAYKNYNVIENFSYVDEFVYTPILYEKINEFDYYINLYTLVGTVSYDQISATKTFSKLFYLDEKDYMTQKPYSYVDEEKFLEIKSILKENSKGKKVVGLHPFASSIHRTIPPNILRFTLETLKDDYLFVMSYPSSQKEIAKIFLNMYPYIYDISEKIKSVKHLGAYIKALDYLISADTVSAHIGASLDKKTLVIMGASPFKSNFDYFCPTLKPIHANFSGKTCSSPCHIHALSSSCEEAKLSNTIFSPCLLSIDEFAIFKSFLELTDINSKIKSKVQKDEEEALSYIEYIENSIREEHSEFSPFSFLTLKKEEPLSLILNIILKYIGDSVYIYGKDKNVLNNILKAFRKKIDINADTALLSYDLEILKNNEDLKDKKIIGFLPNKQRLFKRLNKGKDIFNDGVIDYTKEELLNKLIEIDKREWFICETFPTNYEFQLVFGEIELPNQRLHNNFLKDYVTNKNGGAFLVFSNFPIEISYFDYLESYRKIRELFIEEKELSLYTKTFTGILSYSRAFEIVSFESKFSESVLIMPSPKNALNFYNYFRKKELNPFFLYIDPIKINNPKEKEYLINEIKALNPKAFYIDSSLNLSFLKELLPDLSVNHKLILIETQNPFCFFKEKVLVDKVISNDLELLKLLENKESISGEFFVMPNLDYSNFEDSGLAEKPELLFYSETIVRSPNKINLLKIFNSKYDNFRKSIKSIIKDLEYKDDINIYEELFNGNFDYIYAGASILEDFCKTKKINFLHAGRFEYIPDFKLLKYEKLSKERSLPKLYIKPTQKKSLFLNSKITFILNPIYTFSGFDLNILNVFLAGGFCLTDYRESLKKILGTLADNIMVFNMEEAFEKIEYYLDNEEEKKALSKKIQEKIKNMI